MNGPSLSRRSYLLGTGAMAGLAGCGGLSNVLSGETPAGPIEPPDKDDPLKQRFEVKEREQFFRDTDDGSLNAKASLPDTESLAPVLVHVHGGAYREGGPGFPAMDTFAGAGIGVVSIEYRLGEQADYPNLVRDVGAGVRWVKTNEPEWTLDTDRVAMIGNSAGAHLSALVAAAPNHSNLHPEEYDSEVTADVTALIGHYGIYDFRPDSMCTSGRTKTAMETFFGGSCPGTETRTEASPIAHVDQSHPPTLLFHGTDDQTLFASGSRAYRDEIDVANVSVTYTELEGLGHGYVHPDSENEETVTRESHEQTVGFLFDGPWDSE